MVGQRYPNNPSTNHHSVVDILIRLSRAAEIYICMKKNAQTFFRGPTTKWGKATFYFVVGPLVLIWVSSR